MTTITEKPPSSRKFKVPRPTLKMALCYAVIFAAIIYGISYQDAYILLIITPFFALGCGCDKHPLTVLARATIPALALNSTSALKFKITGVPLVTYDHYFIRENILLLAYNDWRVALCLILGLISLIVYFRGFFLNRSRMTRLEIVSLVALVIAAAICLWNILDWDKDVFDFNAEQNTPSIRAFLKSSQLPKPQIDVLKDIDPPLHTTAQTFLMPPAGGKPDLYFILQESTFHPSLLRSGYEPKFLYAKNSDQTAPLHVHTFGGGTWKSEFSLTVQMRPQEFGGDGMYVFHQLEGRIKRSIFTVLKELGYRTMVFYPVPGNFLNAHNFYKSIGVDEFYDPADLEISKGWDWKLPDSVFYAAMAKKVATSKQPVVAFMLTINQHGPHQSDDPMTDYINRFDASDLAFGDFITSLKKQKRKSGVVAFGDHQPEYTSDLIQEHKDWYQTHYDIRCINFECDKKSVMDHKDKKLDIVLLSTMAFETFGFTLDTFSSLQKSMFRTCETDITHCNDMTRRTFNTAFSQYFR